MTPQRGILDRPPEHLTVAALSFVDRTPPVARETIEALREVVRRELSSDLDDMTPQSPKDQPPAETGELGFADHYDRAALTITLGIAAAGFDALGVPEGERPGDLIEIPWDALGDAPDKHESGDLLLEVCGDDPYVVEHALRRVQEELGARLAVLWTQAGVQRYTTRRGRVSRREARALNGFLDGTSNLRPRDPNDALLIFVDPDRVGEYPPLPQPGQQSGYPGSGPTFPSDLRGPPQHEPAWCKGGTYMVVRSSVLSIDSWDDQTLGVQEATIGRFKYSGASLDVADDPSQLNTEPAFTANQGDTRVPLDSHVRKVNPRRPEDLPRRIFRRGFPLLDATLDGVRRGLVFICFARTLSTQFESSSAPGRRIRTSRSRAPASTAYVSSSTSSAGATTSSRRSGTRASLGAGSCRRRTPSRRQLGEPALAVRRLAGAATPRAWDAVLVAGACDDATRSCSQPSPRTAVRAARPRFR